MTSPRMLQAVAIAYFGATIVGASAFARGADKLDVGKAQYDAACAVCHGLAGKGDGPLGSQLAASMPDLTMLAKKNGGVYPFDRVYQIIDGRQEVKAHGTREMPVWGRAFGLQSPVFFENYYPPYDSESSARARILALTEYLYRLQAK